ncbi:MAG: thioredoxin domain-containing protein [Acidobacteria bacterium]|nr:thioredoxin domain-containing protein [Acidobacteriota bacterium]
MSSPSRRWMAVLALAGLAAAAVSTFVHAQMVSDPTHVSFCDINARVSCTQVYQSRYGSIAGIPVALGGVVWFAGILLLVLAHARGPAASRAHVDGYLLVWSTIGLAVAMYMAYASFFVLQTVCLLCLVVYAAVIGIFVLAGSASATPVIRLPAAAAADLGHLARSPVGLVLALAYAAATVGGSAWFVRAEQAPGFASAAAGESGEPNAAPATSADQQSEFERFWEAQTRMDFTLPASAPHPDAPVIVVKFNDYQCPACASTESIYAPIFAKYASSHPGMVAQVTLDFPLDPECNDETPNGQHDAACEAAVAVRLAAAVSPEARERMADWLYGNQAGLERDTIVEALESIAGVDAARFAARYATEIEQVRLDIATGAALPVQATPTYIINGVLLRGGLAARYFDAALAYEIVRAEAPAP